MPSPVTISLEPRSLDSGLPEECSTFGRLVVKANGYLLTCGIESESNALCEGPLISGYALAEWLVWNWWRIMWEMPSQGSKQTQPEWALAHHMNTAGDGYIWPCIEIESDGKSAKLTSKPSMRGEKALFQYLGTSYPAIIPMCALESAIDGFVQAVLSRLDDSGLQTTNLHCLWRDLNQERQQKDLTRYRKLEAVLGCDADEVDEAVITNYLADADRFGEDAVAELVAAETDGTSPHNGRTWSQEIEDQARGGFDMNAEDTLCLINPKGRPLCGHLHAWRFGESLAQALRQQEGLGDQCIPNDRLAAFAGTVHDIITSPSSRAGKMSFVLNGGNGRAKVTLRPTKWEASRRFELARLIGDRLVHTQIENSNERLYPATTSHSYRQKMQRAFAAEFLCPFQAVETMIGNDLSEEKQDEVASHFKVSPMTVRTQLVNNNMLHPENAPDILERSAPLRAV
ncbi:MAG: hypothetical protein OXE84_13235 [Rhodobacteraceae bacterium]|nr:hypothetical protein [Paracoccaceae bacterium]MCY4196356.1 hypothetical protein [Paracoccaceae bacterium]